MCLVGDFNSKIGSYRAEYGKVMGKYGKGERNENEDVLQHFQEQNGLYLANAHFKHRDRFCVFGSYLFLFNEHECVVCSSHHIFAIAPADC